MGQPTLHMPSTPGWGAARRDALFSIISPSFDVWMGTTHVPAGMFVVSTEGDGWMYGRSGNEWFARSVGWMWMRSGVGAGVSTGVSSCRVSPCVLLSRLGAAHPSTSWPG